MPTYPYALTMTNPGAETGDTTGWTNLQGTLETFSSDGGNTPRTGSFFFRAGAVLATKAYQDISIPVDTEADVDLGVVKVTGAGYHSGFTDGDGGWLGIWCLDSSGRRIGAEIKSNFIHDGVNDWTLRSCTGRVPEGTRTLRFTQYGWRDTGTNLNSYWDDFSLILNYTTETIRQTINGCIYYDRFQGPTGALGSPWTVISGTWNIVNSGIPNFFSSVRETSGLTNRIAIYTDHVAQGDMVVQSQFNNITGTNVGPGIIARSDSAGNNNYLMVSSSFNDNIRLFKQVAGIYTEIDSGSVTQDAGIEYDVKTYFADGVQKAWVDGSLIIDFNDTTHDSVTGYGGYRVHSTVANEVRYDEYSILRSNTITCTNLPSGYKFRVTGPIVDGGSDTTKVATESGGIATVNCDNLWFPANKVEILDATDVVVVDLSQFVWGGDEYEYSLAEQEASDTLTINENIVLGVNVLRPASDTITYSEIITGVQAQQDVNDSIVFVDSSSASLTYERELTDTLTVFEVAEAVRITPASDSIVFSDDTTVEARKFTEDELDITETIGVQYAPHSEFVTEELELTEDALGAAVRSKTITDPISYGEILSFVRVKFPTASDIFIPFDVAVSSTLLSIEDNLNVADDVTFEKIIHREIEDEYILSEILARSVTFNVSATDIYVPIEGSFKTLNLGQKKLFWVPGALGVKTRALVTLQVANSIVVLPRPLLGNTEARKSKVTVKHSINAEKYSYVKRKNTENLKYTFQITRRKARELENFIYDYLSDVVTMTNWRGEIWVGFITNNPFEFKVTERWGPVSERYEFDFEFEGVKVN